MCSLHSYTFLVLVNSTEAERCTHDIKIRPRKNNAVFPWATNPSQKSKIKSLCSGKHTIYIRLFIYSYICLLVCLFVVYLKPVETIQCAVLFSHGTQMAMFFQKCSADIFISKIGMTWGRDPKRKDSTQKTHRLVCFERREWNAPIFGTDVCFKNIFFWPSRPKYSEILIYLMVTQ